MTQESDLLVVNGLRIEGRAGKVWVEIVKGVNIHLRRGEILGLIGESGAGKSTIGLAIMGHIREGCRITSGDVCFDGINMLEINSRERRRIRGRRIAYVAQSAAASFNPAKRLINQYCEDPTLHGVMRHSQASQDAIAMFTRLKLPNPERLSLRYPHEVSGGQLQRAMTAMAMSCRPELIIFDEPTTALDVTTQIEVLAAIRTTVRDFNTAAIYISHDLAVVAQMADRIKVLLRGEEIEEAATAQMISAPQHEYTRSLWAVRALARADAPPVVETSKPVLTIENMSVSYGQVQAVQNVSLSIHPGRTLAVVGESGSGKTTLARAVAGLVSPSQGRTSIDDEVLSPSFRTRSVAQLRQVQMVYQFADTALNPRHRIRELIGRPVALYLGLRGQRLFDRVCDLLRMIELDPDEFIDRRPSELSGGQKQRVGIARALASEPKLIICDEVTSALDRLVAGNILELLSRLQRELGTAYMFITHDIETVRAIADDVVVMQNGQIVDAGPRTVVFTPPHHPYTARLLSSVPDMDPDWLTRQLADRSRSD